MKYTILLVEDEPQIHTFIRISLLAEGFDYLGAESISKAKEHITQHQPNLIILDLGLVDGDGCELLKAIREKSKTPVLILTARDQEEEKIRLLEAGANDYLCKPFGIKELIARIKVLLRDLVNHTIDNTMLEFGQLAFNQHTHQCWLNGKEIPLTKKEFSFMSLLMAAPGQLILQQDLLQQIWGSTHTEDTHYLRILVSQLRKKLNDSADEQRIIKTESGVGYRLISA